MSVRRGDVVVVNWPFTGGGSKARPAVIVQNDKDNARMTNTIVVMFTSVTRRSGEPTQLLIEVSTPDGKLTGLHRDSVVNCSNLLTIEQSSVISTIGRMSATLIALVDDCLKASLDLK